MALCGSSLYKTLLNTCTLSLPRHWEQNYVASGEHESQTNYSSVQWFSLSVAPDSLFVENKKNKFIILSSLEGWLMHSNCVPIPLQIAVHLEVHLDMKFCRTL